MNYKKHDKIVRIDNLDDEGDLREKEEALCACLSPTPDSDNECCRVCGELLFKEH